MSLSPAAIFALLDDRKTLALTAWAEARGIPRNDPRDHSPVEELIAVMSVVRNRRPRFTRWRATDPSYKAICLAPSQFSCWIPGSGSNHTALMVQAEAVATWDDRTVLDAQIRECLYLADGIIGGAIIDRTGGATSYYAPDAMVPPGRVPGWAKSQTSNELLPMITIGDQNFVRLV